MARKVLRITGWIVAAVAGFAVTLYSLALAINWRDREPSAAAVELGKLYRDRPPVKDEDNGFVYVMGFAAPVGDDPYQVGLRRVAWVEKSNQTGPLDRAQDPLREKIDYQAGRVQVVRDFITACKPGGSGCTAAFNAGDVAFDSWIASEGWLLQRYQQLIDHRGWRESVPLDVALPLPAYSLVMDGQKLFLLNAKVSASRRDYERVRKLLEDDLSFWRRAIESSDTLITKMIAVAAINRHFELGNLVLRQIPAKEVMSAVPTAWRTPISASELSMRRVLAGEWRFMSAALRNVHPDSHLQDESAIDWMSARLLLPLYQYQDTINRNAEYLTEITQLLSVPLDQYESAASRTADLSERTRRGSLPPHSLYNIFGRVLLGIGASDFGTYGRRVADLEGVRRAALVAVTLRSNNVGAHQLQAALNASTLREPFHNRSFESEENPGAVIFRGLEKGERSVHRMLY